MKFSKLFSRFWFLLTVQFFKLLKGEESMELYVLENKWWRECSLCAVCTDKSSKKKELVDKKLEFKAGSELLSIRIVESVALVIC